MIILPKEFDGWLLQFKYKCLYMTFEYFLNNSSSALDNWSVSFSTVYVII